MYCIPDQIVKITEIKIKENEIAGKRAVIILSRLKPLKSNQISAPRVKAVLTLPSQAAATTLFSPTATSLAAVTKNSRVKIKITETK